MPVACPHCSATQERPGRFCVSCGKALPDANAGVPKVVAGPDLAASSAGRSLQADQLARELRTGWITLLVVGILQLVGAVAVAGVSRLIPESARAYLFMSVMLGGVGAIFVAMSFWARRDPLAATLSGLVLFVSLWILDIVADPSTAAQGLLIRLVITAFLARALVAGIKHRALKRQLEQEQAGGRPATDAMRRAA